MLSLNNRIKKSKLTEIQINIAKIVTSDLHRIAFLSGKQLAQECGVSIAAITRFAQKLGYKGFPEFKSELEVLYRKTTTPYEMFESFIKKSEGKSVVDMSISQDIENIQNMKMNFDTKTFQIAVKKIYNSSLIHLAGIGSSEILVDFSHLYFDALDKKTNKLKSFGISKVAELTEFKKDHVLIGFSFQRILKEVCEVFRHAKKSNTTLIAITDSVANPLALEADIVLVTPVIGTTFGLSHVAPLAMINLLISSVAAVNRKKSLEKLKKAKEVWEKYPIFCDC